MAAVQGWAASLGTPIRYVKPHGALYNRAADDEMEALNKSAQGVAENIAKLNLRGE